MCKDLITSSCCGYDCGQDWKAEQRAVTQEPGLWRIFGSLPNLANIAIDLELFCLWYCLLLHRYNKQNTKCQAAQQLVDMDVQHGGCNEVCLV